MLKIVLLISASGIAAGGLYASGALAPGETYDLPLSEVRSRLAGMPLPAEVLRPAAGSDAARASTSLDETSVRWTVSSGGAGQPAVFVANLHRESAQRTRVSVEYRPAASGERNLDLLTGTRFFRGYSEAAFTQAVDARLEQRPYDYGAALQTFAKQASRDPEVVRELGLSVQAMWDGVQDQMRDHANPAPLPSNPKQAMRDATRPTVELPNNR